MTELRLVTGILSQVAGQDFTNSALYPDIPQAVLMEIQGHLLRIQVYEYLQISAILITIFNWAEKRQILGDFALSC